MTQNYKDLVNEVHFVMNNWFGKQRENINPLARFNELISFVFFSLGTQNKRKQPGKQVQIASDYVHTGTFAFGAGQV